MNTHNKHWSQLRERGSYWGMAFSLWCYRIFGRRALELLLYPIISYFFLTHRAARQHSQHFLQRVYAFAQTTGEHCYFDKKPTLRHSFCHLMNFGYSIADRISAGSGLINRDHLFFERREELLRLAREGNGCVIMTSHLGGTEMMRALIEYIPDVRMNVLGFTDHVQRFNRLAKDLNSTANIELIEISTLDPGTAVFLKEKIDAGEFVVVAADRTSPTAIDRVSYSAFLGHKAPFPQGVFILAGLMACPVYLLFCLNEKGRHTVYFEKFSDKIVLPRKQRKEKLQMYTDQYANRLQHYCCKAPLQWFNFYDFWSEKKHTDS